MGRGVFFNLAIARGAFSLLVLLVGRLIVVHGRQFFSAFNLMLKLLIPRGDVFQDRLGVAELTLLLGRLLPLHLRALG